MARWKYKEIIFAVLHVQEMQNERRNDDGSPVGPPDYEYTLDVSYHPLDLGVPRCCGAFTPSMRVVSRRGGSILRPFGPRRATAMLRAGCSRSGI